MRKRVTPDEFVRQLKMAPVFYLAHDELSALLLFVKNTDGTTSEFTGPEFTEMTELEIRSFLENVKAACELPEIARGGWMDTIT